MRWPFVIEEWTARLLADSALISVMGERPWLFHGQAVRPVRVPSIEYLMFDDEQEEVFNPIQVQVDIWAPGPKVKQIENRIWLLTHRSVGQDVGGERMWLQHRGTTTGTYDGPIKNTIHRIMDFEFKPVRQLA